MFERINGRPDDEMYKIRSDDRRQIKRPGQNPTAADQRKTAKQSNKIKKKSKIL
ncbi:hypothetical protein NE609_10210 [Anaerotruncus sp. DFI.9.16]|nr:hypothetical protein [Anaerotruncus sp. DFI.9.16]